MIDRQQYRQQLQTLTDDQLDQAGVSIWRDIHHCRPAVSERCRLWREWDDVAAELARRGQTLLIEEIFRRVRAERRQPSETAREFLQRSNREIQERRS